MSINELNNEIDVLEMEKNDIEGKIQEKLKNSILGIKVMHKKYGKGKIVKQEENKISVEFINNDIKTFQIPTAFTNEFLTCDSKEILRQMNELKSLIDEKTEIEKKKYLLECQQKQNEAKKQEKTKPVIKHTTMIAVTTNNSFDEDKKINLYYCKAEKIKQQCEYIGLYKDKAIKAIGRIKKVIEANSINGELVVSLVYGKPIVEEDKEKIKESIDKSIQMFNYDIGQRNHKYFIVEKFIDTDFRKVSPGGLMGNKYFDLYDILGVQTLPPPDELARILEEKEWE